MTKPRKLIIGYLNWKVKWVKKIPDHPEAKGVADTESQTIWICTKFGLETQRHTLLHEILHAIWYGYHLNPSKKDLEENIVSALSAPLLEVLDSHDDVRAFLFPS